MIFFCEDRFGRKVVDVLTQHTDLFPTLAGVVGLKTPEIAMDGSSLKPHLLGESENQVRQFLCFEDSYAISRVGIRTKRYKYIVSWRSDGNYCTYCGRFHGDLEELYDVTTDPFEEKNIARENAKLSQNLRKILLLFYKSKYRRRVVNRISKMREATQ